MRTRTRTAVATAVTLLAVAAAPVAWGAHEQAHRGCFGHAVAAQAGPVLGDLVPFLAQSFRPIGAIFSVEARTCEELFDE